MEPIHDINGTLIHRVKTNNGKHTTIFVPLPPENWRSCGNCACKYCNGDPGYWDTLVIDKNPPRGHRADHVRTCHYPEINPWRTKGVTPQSTADYWKLRESAKE